jgi:hypothetical protein
MKLNTPLVLPMLVLHFAFSIAAPLVTGKIRFSSSDKLILTKA